MTTPRLNGVEVITLDKFLNQIGYAPDDRTVQLGAGARASDFPPQPETRGARRSACGAPGEASSAARQIADRLQQLSSASIFA